jgi:Acyl-CoA synthetases (AMP-forming)/AMP-acid ligases II
VNGPPLPRPKHRTVNESLAASATSGTGLTFVDLAERETFHSYEAIRARARRTAGALRARGVAPGDRVALVLPTSPTFVDAFFGVLLAGAVPVPLYPPVRLGRLAEYLVATSRMIAAVGARLVLARRRDAPSSREVDRVFAPGAGGASRRRSSGRRRARGGRRARRARADPVLVRVDRGAQARRPLAREPAGPARGPSGLLPAEGAVPQKGVSWLPLYHDMGLIGCLLQAVYYPGPLVLIPPELFLAKPALWLRAIARHRATISVAPSFAYALCSRKVRDEELSGADLSSWRHALCGAEPVSPDRSTFRTAFRAVRLRPAEPAARLRPGRGRARRHVHPRRPRVRSLHVDPVRLAAAGDVVDGARADRLGRDAGPGHRRRGARSRRTALEERRVGGSSCAGPR